MADHVWYRPAVVYGNDVRYALLVLVLVACGKPEPKVIATNEELTREHQLFTFEACREPMWEHFPRADELRKADLVLLEGGVLRMEFQVWNGARPPQYATCDVSTNGIVIREHQEE